VRVTQCWGDKSHQSGGENPVCFLTISRQRVHLCCSAGLKADRLHRPRFPIKNLAVYLKRGRSSSPLHVEFGCAMAGQSRYKLQAAGKRSNESIRSKARLDRERSPGKAGSQIARNIQDKGDLPQMTDIRLLDARKGRGGLDVSVNTLPYQRRKTGHKSKVCWKMT
jgi:hypothetical protein